MNKSSLSRHAASLCGLTAVAALCAVLGGCGSSTKTYPTVHNATVNKAQVRESADVAQGQTLTVRLPTEGKTTFVWRMTGQTAKNDMVEFIKRHEQQNAAGKFASKGEPAWDVFTFRAKRTGQVSMAFIYEHVYSANDPIRKYSLDVDVITPEMASATASAE